MKRRILLISNCFPNRYKPYACAYVQRHAQLHERDGWHIEIVTIEDSRQGAFSFLKYLRLLFRVWSKLFTRDYDLIHAHWPFPSGVFAALLAIATRRPLVITSHGAFVQDFEKRPPPVRWLTRWALQQADSVIAVGDAHAERVAQVTGRARAEIVVGNMGVWLEQPIPTQTESRRALQLSPDDSVVLFLGNLVHRKGADIFLRAVGKTAARFEAARFFIAGQGAEEASLKRLQQQLGLAQRVSFIGPIKPDMVFTWLAAADVVVIPSRTEPFGLVPIEAMACRTAVLVSDAGQLKQTVQDDVNGLVFPVEDVEACANRLQQLLSDPALRARLAQRAAQTVSQYDMRVEAAKVTAVYKKHLNYET